ncbi:hypothetical protein FCOIX_5765 [Fusarium coicis]|nr:hypothetical protein FCOIX_5765 [Fusarium coicis]
MDPMHREKLTYSLQKMFESFFIGGGVRGFNSIHENIPIDITSEVIEQSLARSDDKYGEFLKRKNMLGFTANENWLEEALKIPAEGSMRSRYYSDYIKPAVEAPEDKCQTQLKHTIDKELEALTCVEKESYTKDMELLTFCPATIERSFALLKPFDYTE